MKRLIIIAHLLMLLAGRGHAALRAADSMVRISGVDCFTVAAAVASRR
jgi:hypothetical protein